MNDQTSNRRARNEHCRPALFGVVITALLFALMVGYSQSAQAQWTTSGADMRNTAGGNVGIGTAGQPTTGRIHIAAPNDSGGYPLIKLENTQTNGHTYWLYSGASGIAGDFGLYDESTTTGGYKFYVTGLTGHVSMGLTGNVGINTTSPGAKLEIKDGASADQFRMGDGTNLYKIGRNTGDGLLEFRGTQASYAGYRFKSPSGLDILTMYRVDRSGGENSTEVILGRGQGTNSLLGGTLRAPDAAGTNVAGANLTIASGLATGTATAGDIIFQGATATTSGTTVQSAATLMTIKGGTGTVGIGLTNPNSNYKLDVNGAVNATSINAATITQNGVPLSASQWTTSASNISYSAGNVGIGGAAAADKKLTVVGDISSVGNIDSTGTITGGNIIAKYQDVAEWVPSTRAIPAATVVVLDPTQSNHVLPSMHAYDTRVAGVVSAQPGIALGEKGEGKVLVATTGRVKVKVDATRAPIQVGDLLVTGETEGVAIKSEPLQVGGAQLHRPGTIIGKALEPLPQGTGEILVLLSLQ